MSWKSFSPVEYFDQYFCHCKKASETILLQIIRVVEPFAGAIQNLDLGLHHSCHTISIT